MGKSWLKMILWNVVVFSITLGVSAGRLDGGEDHRTPLRCPTSQAEPSAENTCAEPSLPPPHPTPRIAVGDVYNYYKNTPEWSTQIHLKFATYQDKLEALNTAAKALLADFLDLGEIGAFLCRTGEETVERLRACTRENTSLQKDAAADKRVIGGLKQILVKEKQDRTEFQQKEKALLENLIRKNHLASLDVQKFLDKLDVANKELEAMKESLEVSTDALAVKVDALAECQGAVAKLGKEVVELEREVRAKDQAISKLSLEHEKKTKVDASLVRSIQQLQDMVNLRQLFNDFRRSPSGRRIDGQYLLDWARSSQSIEIAARNQERHSNPKLKEKPTDYPLADIQILTRKPTFSSIVISLSGEKIRLRKIMNDGASSTKEKNDIQKQVAILNNQIKGLKMVAGSFKPTLEQEENVGGFKWSKEIGEAFAQWCMYIAEANEACHPDMLGIELLNSIKSRAEKGELKHQGWEMGEIVIAVINHAIANDVQALNE